MRTPRRLQIGLDAFGAWLFIAAAAFGLVSCVATVVGTAAGVRAQDGHGAASASVVMASSHSKTDSRASAAR